VTVTLTGKAGPSGVTVTLSSSDGTTIPAGTTLTIPSGATYAKYTFTPAVVPANKTVTVTASLGGVSRGGAVQIKAATISQLLSNVSSVTSGQTLALQARLTSPAPAGGLTVSLSSSNASAIAVSGVSISVPGGATYGTASVPVGTVDASTPVTLTGTTGSVSQTFSVSVVPAVLQTLSVPASVKGGTSGNVTVYLTGKAGPSGIAVSVSSSDGVTIPSGTVLTVPSGSSSASLKVTPGVVTSDTAVTITAAEGGVTKTGTLTVKA
jgi:hypothetical protein